MVPAPESIADHMYRLTLILYTLLPFTNPTGPAAAASASANGTAQHHSDQQQSLLMSLTHDLAEAITGDITPTQYSGVSKADKHARETDAMHHMLAHLTHTQRTEVHTLWHDYETDHSDLSRLLHDADKLEMVIQAFEYEREEHRRKRGSASAVGGRRLSVGIGSGQKGLDRFYESVKKIRDERVRQIAHEVLRRRHAELLDGIGMECEEVLRSPATRPTVSPARALERKLDDDEEEDDE